MNPIRRLTTWLGRPQKRTRRGLLIEPLEDRVTPTASPKLLANPVSLAHLPTTQDLIALTPSGKSISDLANVVAHLALDNVVDVANSSVVFSSPSASYVRIHLRPGVAARDAAQTMYSTGLYAFVSPNYIYPPGLTGRDLKELVPNDPHYPVQFPHAIIDAPRAWDTTFGDSSVVVAVLDDGVDITHPDLVDNIWINTGETPGDGIDNDNNGFIDDRFGWDFVHNSNTVAPDNAIDDPHGTQVAGILAGRINNSAGVAGVAGLANIMPLKVLGGGSTTSLTILQAVNYAVSNGVKIINSSINVDPFIDDPTFRAAVGQAFNSGVLWVNSAGNLNLQDPARAKLNDMLIVAASDRTDKKTSYSNFGWGIDISAPGGSGSDPVTTTIPGGYGPAWGTSVSAPLVAGTAALLWSANPSWTLDQVVSAILANTDSLDTANPNFTDKLGVGRLDAGESVSGGEFVTRLGRMYEMPGPGQDPPPGFNSFRLRLLGNLDSNTVTPSHFELRWAGPDNTFDTGDDQLVPLGLAGDYKFGVNSLDFTIGAGLAKGLYRFTAISGGLRDPFGTAIDGDNNGTAGGNYVRFFGNPVALQGQVVYDISNGGPTSPPTSPPGVPGAGVFPDFNNNGAWDTTTFNSTTAPQAIPDNPATPAFFAINAMGFTRPVNYLRVRVELVHPVPSDLIIRIISPDGASVILFANRPVPGGNSAATQIFNFDDNIVEATIITPTLITRNLRPEQPLASLYGGSANGVWRVEVSDTTPGDTGTLISARVIIGQEPLAITGPDGRFIIGNLPAEPIAIRVLPPTGFEVRGLDKNPAYMIGASRLEPFDLEIVLVRSDGITGRVLDGANPADSFTLYIDDDNDGIFENGERTAITDADGLYEFFNVDPGTYAIRILDKPSYSLQTTVRTVTLTPNGDLSTGNDFSVHRDTGPVVVTLPDLSPGIRTTPIDDIAIELSEPVDGLKLADLRLSRNGSPISLESATFIGSSTTFTLIGLGDKTSTDGYYTLTILAPPPEGQPDRTPAPAVMSWTLDATPPTATIAPSVGPHGIVDSVTIAFSSPVNGLDLTDFTLKRNGVALSLAGAFLSPAAAPNTFVISNLAAVGKQAGSYELLLRANESGITDIAGNPLTPLAPVQWTVIPRPVRLTAAAAGEGSQPTVIVFDADGKQIRSFSPYDPQFSGGVRVATGDVNGDLVDDIIVAPGRNSGPRIKVYDGKTGFIIHDFFGFEENFRGGVHVAAGDLTGDGIAEIVLTPDRGGGPRVRVFDGITLKTVADFFGIDDVNFRGGARAALGDVTGDGRADLVVSAGTGGGPRIAVFDGPSVAMNIPNKPFGDFLAFESSLRNGAYVAVADLNNDGRGEVIAVAGDGGGPRFSAFSGAMLMQNKIQKLSDFFVGEESARTGLRLAVDDVNDDGVNEVFVAPGTGSRIRVFAAASLLSPQPASMREFDPFNNFAGGVYLG